MSTSRRNKEITVTKAYYEKYADLWARTHANPFHDEKEFTILRSYLKKNASVLDIGCAAGVLLPLFMGIGEGLKYHGIDITKRFISIARRRYPQIEFSLADIADKGTLPKKKFDAFIARSVIMHLPHALWDTAFENIRSVMKPGAYGYVVLPSSRPPSMDPGADTRHFTLLSEAEQIAHFKKHGWKILKKFKHATGPTKANWIGYIVQIP